MYKAGDLLFCKSRSNTECCFKNHTCVDSWKEINKEFGSEAINYMKDKVGFFYFYQLSHFILLMKFSTGSFTLSTVMHTPTLNHAFWFIA